MLDFKPPKPNPLVIRLCKLLIPFALRHFLKISRLELDSESSERLKAIEGNSAILIPNHPDIADALTMFVLSKRISAQFYYMAAREVFDEWNFLGLTGGILQRGGAYSVVRGAVDREAFRTTRTILKEGKHPLVIFAEGGVTRQNDTVTPFESGVVQFGFWALDDIKKAGDVKPLYAVPIGIKYVYDREMWDAVKKSLARLEREILPQNSQPAETLYNRLRAVGTAAMSTLEHEYKLPVDTEKSLNERIQRLREHILSQMEAFMNTKPPRESSPRTRVRALKNLIDAEVYREADEMTDYERRVHEQRLEQFQQFYRDVERMFNFIAIYDGYVGENPSPERFLEVISRLELEVFGQSKLKGRRTAFIRVGTPKNLLDSYESYRKDKRQTTQRLTLELEREVQGLISGI